MATLVSKFNPAISDMLFNIYTVFSLTRLITSAPYSIFFTAVCSDSHSSLHKFAHISAHSFSVLNTYSLTHAHTQKKRQDCCCVGLNFSSYHQRISISSNTKINFYSPVSCYFLFLRFFVKCCFAHELNNKTVE